MQDHWLLLGAVDNTYCVYDFDFATLAWSQATLTGAPFRSGQMNFMSTCHWGALIVTGGKTTSHCIMLSMMTANHERYWVTI